MFGACAGKTDSKSWFKDEGYASGPARPPVLDLVPNEIRLVGEAPRCHDLKRLLQHRRGRPEGGAVADERVKRSLYERAVGYSYDSEKILYDAQSGEVIRAPIVVHVPPDVTAQIFWLKNRDPKNWRDRREVGMDGRMTTTRITSTMTPKQAMEAFVATIRGAEIVEPPKQIEQDEECCKALVE